MSKRVENPQKYCNFYQKFIVEELVFLENFFDLHYGNCAVIGKISEDEDDDGSYYLENLRLDCLELQYQLPEGSVKIRLLNNLFTDSIPVGKKAEIHGKAVLYNTRKKSENYLPITLQDVYFRFNNFLESYENTEGLDLAALKNLFNQSLLETYEPAIQVRFINLCNTAENIIAYNLQIRSLSGMNYNE